MNLKRKHWKESADKKPKDRLQQVFKRQMAQAESRTKSAAIPQAQQKYLVDAYRCPLGPTTMDSRSVCIGGAHQQTAPPNPDCLFGDLTVQSQKLMHLKLSGSVWRQCCWHLHLYCLSLAEPSLYQPLVQEVKFTLLRSGNSIAMQKPVESFHHNKFKTGLRLADFQYLSTWQPKFMTG